jgi:membrane dipeptidase
MLNNSPLIFDGHNDVLFKMFCAETANEPGEFATGRSGAIDLPKAIAGGFGGGFFAIYVPSAPGEIDRFDEMNKPSYDLPLPDELQFSEANRVAQIQASCLIRLRDLGALEICTTAKQIDDCIKRNKLAAIMHMEGAEAIDEDFHALDVFYNAGLRSLGPVWSRPNKFGHGVPFRFPSDGNIGHGLTDSGTRLVRRCNQLRIMLDLSHLNEAGFWDVARLSDAPLVATHSNVHNLCASSRNLTDRQLDAIAESDGMVGVNFAVAFLRPDGQKNVETSLDVLIRHIDYLIERLGEDRVGFGSDYDGAEVPKEIFSIADLPNLRTAMRSHGYNETLMNKLCHRNWLRVLEKTWGV